MIYILVPVFKRLEKTVTFFESLDSSINEPYEIIVCDDSLDFEHGKNFEGTKNVHVVQGSGDLYWGGGVNACIECLNNKFDVCEEDIIVFANNDIRLHEDSFATLRSLLNEHPDTIFHPGLIDQEGRIISAGSKVRLWFPFITTHESGSSNSLFRVDFASARFLMFSGKTLSVLKCINRKLPHYGGDNDFTFRAKKVGIKTYIATEAICYVDESDTGYKVGNIDSLGGLIKSFDSLKSPNSIKYRYLFMSSHFNPLFSALIVLSMTLKSIVAYSLRRVL